MREMYESGSIFPGVEIWGSFKKNVSGGKALLQRLITYVDDDGTDVLTFDGSLSEICKLAIKFHLSLNEKPFLGTATVVPKYTFLSQAKPAPRTVPVHRTPTENSTRTPGPNPIQQPNLPAILLRRTKPVTLPPVLNPGSALSPGRSSWTPRAAALLQPKKRRLPQKPVSSLGSALSPGRASWTPHATTLLQPKKRKLPKKPVVSSPMPETDPRVQLPKRRKVAPEIQAINSSLRPQTTTSSFHHYLPPREISEMIFDSSPNVSFRKAYRWTCLVFDISIIWESKWVFRLSVKYLRYCGVRFESVHCLSIKWVLCKVNHATPFHL